MFLQTGLCGFPKAQELHTLYPEKSPVLFVLSIKNFSESMEGSGYKQMTPKLENKAFLAKSTKCIGLKHHKEPL